MDELSVTIGFPGASRPAANEMAEELLAEIKQLPELRRSLDLDRTGVQTTDREAQDFGVTLIAVLGTPAVLILANTIKSWIERTGTTTLEMNGIRIDNLRSKDVGGIAAALASGGTSKGRATAGGRKPKDTSSAPAVKGKAPAAKEPSPKAPSAKPPPARAPARKTGSTGTKSASAKAKQPAR